MGDDEDAVGWRDESASFDKIINGDALEAVFGYWPSFHDANVLAVRLIADDEPGTAVMEADVHVFEITRDVTPLGYLALRHHTIATFRFENVSNVKIDGWSFQNSVFGLSFKHTCSPPFPGLDWEVSFDSSNGMDASLNCEDVLLMEVLPYDAPEPVISVEELRSLSREDRERLTAKRRAGSD